MRTLFVYYSFEGNCRLLAKHMADAVGGDTAELIPVEETMPRGAIAKYIAGGKASLLKQTTRLEPLTHNPAEYDLTVVGGPVWFLNITPAVRTFLGGTDWNGRKVALFAMHRGGKGSALATMRKLAEERGGTIAAPVEFTDLRRGNAEGTKEKAAAWAASLTK